MWFKNLFLFKFENSFALNAIELHAELLKKPFAPCLSEQRTSIGWISPLGQDTKELSHQVNGNILFSMMKQEKILPSSVIADNLSERIAEIEEKQNRKVSAKEKREIREDIEHELLPRAFSKNTKLDAWINKKGDYLIINTSSAPRAEEFATLLRKTLGSLPITLPETETHPAVTMTQWLSNLKPADNFSIGHECNLKNHGDDKGQTTYKKHDLSLDEVHANLEAGKFVSELALEWDDKISFVLTENLVIKKLKFLNLLEDKLTNEDPKTHAEHVDIEFALMAGEVELLVNDIFNGLDPDNEVERTAKNVD